jgi:hypothetical protein
MPLRWSRTSRTRVDTRLLDDARLDDPQGDDASLGGLTALVALGGLAATLILLTSP